MAKSKRETELANQVAELTEDLQRLRADFENYRKRVEAEKDSLRELTKAATVMKLLPMIDNIERAILHMPNDLANNKWAQGVQQLVKNLEKQLKDLGIERIEAGPGTEFNHDVHEAISVEEGDGEREIISEELRAGYKMGDQVVRHSMVRVKK